MNGIRLFVKLSIVLVILVLLIGSINAYTVSVVWPGEEMFAVSGLQSILYALFYNYRFVILHTPTTIHFFAYSVDSHYLIPNCTANIENITRLVYMQDDYIDAVAWRLKKITYNNKYLLVIYAAEIIEALTYPLDENNYSRINCPRNTLILGQGTSYDIPIALMNILIHAGVNETILVIGENTRTGRTYIVVGTSIPPIYSYYTNPSKIFFNRKTFYPIDVLANPKPNPKILPEFYDTGTLFTHIKPTIIVYNNTSYNVYITP